MLERKSAVEIKKWLLSKEKSALLVTGARQVGKTYLIRNTLKQNNTEYVELNFIERPELISLFENVTNVDDFFLRLSMVTKKELHPGKTMLFFDEIQECKEIVTWIKFLVDDGRYRYILSGSLLGVELSDLKSAPVGYLEIIDMYPLDLMEFFMAVGISGDTLSLIKTAYETKTALDEFVHNQLMRAFNLYLIIGGMPDAVQTYVDTNDISKVQRIQENLIRQYKVDFTKYEKNSKLSLIEIYDAIPSELEEKNKRFFISHIAGKTSYDRMKNSFFWLKDAGVAIPVYNVVDTKSPLKISEKRNLFKLFLSDVGLLCSLYPNEVKFKILENDKDINNGGLYENVVAQELCSKNIPLYYYNSKKNGELDFVVEIDGKVLPIEVKSGKSYEKHSALSNVINNESNEVEEAIVLCNANVTVKNGVSYLPIYMMMFIENKKIDGMIYKLDLKGIS